MSMGKRVLVVDDETAVRELVEALLRHDGYDVETAEGGAEALAKIGQYPFDLVLTDYLMPEMTGDELARQIKRLKPCLPIILLTGYPPETPCAEISGVLLKPFARQKLRDAIAAFTSPTPKPSGG